jgi:hypothetical protein
VFRAVGVRQARAGARVRRIRQRRVVVARFDASRCPPTSGILRQFTHLGAAVARAGLRTMAIATVVGLGLNPDQGIGRQDLRPSQQGCRGQQQSTIEETAPGLGREGRGHGGTILLGALEKNLWSRAAEKNITGVIGLGRGAGCWEVRKGEVPDSGFGGFQSELQGRIWGSDFASRRNVSY